jgi:hypothetical protein
VIDQKVRIGALGARAVVLAQEPVGRGMLASVRPHDRPRPPPTVAVDPLHSQLADHHSPRHTPPPDPNVTDIANPVGKQPRDEAKVT